MFFNEKNTVNDRVKRVRKQLLEIHNRFCEKKMNVDGSTVIDLFEFCKVDDKDLLVTLNYFTNCAVELEGIQEAYLNDEKEIVKELTKLEQKIQKKIKEV